MQSDSPNAISSCPPLPIGNSDWAAVKAGYWSADKTKLISGLLDRKATVALFTRQRRFGKTFALKMLKAFFEKAEILIDEKRYAAEMEEAGLRVLKYGIGFHGKHVALAN